MNSQTISSVFSTALGSTPMGRRWLWSRKIQLLLRKTAFWSQLYIALLWGDGLYKSVSRDIQSLCPGKEHLGLTILQNDGAGSKESQFWVAGAALVIAGVKLQGGRTHVCGQQKTLGQGVNSNENDSFPLGVILIWCCISWKGQQMSEGAVREILVTWEGVSLRLLYLINLSVPHQPVSAPFWEPHRTALCVWRWFDSHVQGHTDIVPILSWHIISFVKYVLHCQWLPAPVKDSH